MSIEMPRSIIPMEATSSARRQISREDLVDRARELQVPEEHTDRWLDALTIALGSKNQPAGIERVFNYLGFKLAKGK